MELNERVLLSASNKQEFESLLKEYRPFIASCASRMSGRLIDEHDDEMSVATIAFSEAMGRFRPENGRFLNFASCVIRSRLIDHFRANGHRPETVSLDDPETENSVFSEMRDDTFLFPAEDPVKIEIEMLSSALKTYGINFMDLTKCSPKHKTTKKDCLKAALCIINHNELLKQLKRTRQLPVKNITFITGVHRKTLERHRNYIVCLAEILSGEYVYLSEYVQFAREEQ